MIIFDPEDYVHVRDLKYLETVHELIENVGYHVYKTQDGVKALQAFEALTYVWNKETHGCKLSFDKENEVDY